MVYHGPSRGCNSCKRRRKKCDGTRPSCMRCLKASRACGGYEDPGFSRFRIYEAHDPNQSSFITTARKCTMPKRLPYPGTDVLPEDILPSETSQSESNALSLRAFFYDFCITSPNPAISRGYLSGLEMLTYRAGSKSNLVKACQTVAFATHGKPLNRPTLVHKASVFYEELIGALAQALQNTVLAKNKETRFCAMLLGIYQMTISGVSNFGNHEVHARGLSAIMKVGTSPWNLLSTPSFSFELEPKINISNRQLSSIFSVPALGHNIESLDDLLLVLDSLYKPSESTFATDPEKLREKSYALGERFVQWQNSRAPEHKPTAVGEVTQAQPEAEISVGYWPGNADAYFDLRIAGVWNIFRAARLLLIALIIKTSEIEDFSAHIQISHSIVQDMISSIPYHLTDNLQLFLGQQSKYREISDPGKYLGGLLLIHPLYVASEMSFIPLEMREYLRRTLAWIGTNMGLGQATTLAYTPGIDRDFLASGCMIIWSGFVE